MLNNKYLFCLKQIVYILIKLNFMITKILNNLKSKWVIF